MQSTKTICRFKEGSLGGHGRISREGAGGRGIHDCSCFPRSLFMHSDHLEGPCVTSALKQIEGWRTEQLSREISEGW